MYYAIFETWEVVSLAFSHIATAKPIYNLSPSLPPPTTITKTSITLVISMQFSFYFDNSDFNKAQSFNWSGF
jgi:hypothetical protein